MVLPVIKQNILTFFLEIFHLNCCIDSKVTAILLNGWILPTGGVAAGLFRRNEHLLKPGNQEYLNN